MPKIYLRRFSYFWLFVFLGCSALATQPLAGPIAWAGNSPAWSSAQPYYTPNFPTGANRHKIGIATHPWWLDMHLETFISRFKELKIGVIRLPFEWKVIEPQPGRYDWTVNDRLLNRLNDEGFEVVPEFVTIPVWASSNPVACAKYDLDCGFNPVASAQFEAVVQAAARRYPFIRQWEFWNEPEQWPNAGKDVNVYGAWLKLFYRAIKRADPTLQVAATTLAGPNYLNILYDYIEKTTGAKNYPWDAVAYHPYNLDGETDENGVAFIAKKRIERMRQMMIDHGEGYKPIWITEIRFEGDSGSQSAQFKSAFDWMNSKDYISMIALHMLHDWKEEQAGLMATVPQTFPWVGDISPVTKFVPKQPYYDTFKNYPRRVLGPAPTANPDLLVFKETGHTLRGIFLKTWQSRGGLELFGFPKTGQFYERNAATGQYYLVQYFERVRMEYHPENKGTPFEILFGLLGNELMVEQGLLDQNGRPNHPATQPESRASGPDNLFFEETKHNLGGPFLAAWKKQGGLAIIGFPRSAVFETKGGDGLPLKIQYFERARMELHTTPDGQQIVLFGLLSNQRLLTQGRVLDNYQPNQENFYNPANFEFLT